jgi:hypothetical protein
MTRAATGIKKTLLPANTDSNSLNLGSSIAPATSARSSSKSVIQLQANSQTQLWQAKSKSRNVEPDSTQASAKADETGKKIEWREGSPSLLECVPPSVATPLDDKQLAVTARAHATTEDYTSWATVRHGLKLRFKCAAIACLSLCDT